jgi:hypothetical protein
MTRRWINKIVGEILIGVLAFLLVVSAADAASFNVVRIDNPDPCEGAWFGKSVDGLGDIDGDGIGDLAVGAPGVDMVYLLSGDDQSVIDIFEDPCSYNGHWFGHSVQGVGDIDGLGKEDVGVGAPGDLSVTATPACGPWPTLECLARHGRVFVFSGDTGGQILWFGESTPVAKYNYRFGAAVAPLGDVNDDGTPDIAAGAPALLSLYLGNVYGLSGSDAITLWDSEEPPMPGEASQTRSSLGQFMREVSDLNGDGKRELLVAAHWYDYDPDPTVWQMAGRAYVLDGSDGSIIRAHDDPDPCDGDYFGVGQGGIGDQDGDGVEDYAFGEAGVGILRMFSGSSGSFIDQIDSPDDETGYYFGFGFQIVKVGDNDGDGLDDFWVSSPDGGSVYLMNSSGAVLAQVDDPNLVAVGTVGGFGWSMSATGDLNGDGKPELIVGKSVETVGGFADAGAVFLVIGNRPPVADAGDDQIVECECNLTEGTTVALDGTGSSDPDEDALSYSWTGSFEESPASGPTPTVTLSDGCPGEYVITLVVNDGLEDSEPNDVVITVEDSAGPEITLNGSDPMTLECGIDSYVEPGATAWDDCDGDVAVVIGGDTVDTSMCGTYVVSYEATDAAANGAQEERIVEVEDTTPPEISLVVEPNVLRPPNHKMVEIVPTLTVSDNCDESPEVILLSITMNEGEETNTYDPMYDNTVGDGHTVDDIQVDAGRMWLRAERSGKGDGRVYYITYRAVDGEGNYADAMATVIVPHGER